MLLAIASVVIFAMVSGCSPPPPRAPAPVPAVADSELHAPNEAAAPAAPKLAFVTDPEPGVHVHLASGYRFAGQYEGCLRNNENVHDGEARDVSVTYGCDAGALVLTLYVYPSMERDLERHFAEVMETIQAFHPDAMMEAATEVTSPFGDAKRPGRMSQVRWLEEDTEMSSLTMLFDDGSGWFLKVRASFDASAEEASKLASELYGAALKGSIFVR